MAKLVTGLFKARSSAMLAIEDLMRHNISQEDISVSMTDSASGREFFPEVASKAPEYGVTGTIIGGIIGAVVAALIALGYIVDNGFTGLAGVNLFVATFCGLGVGMLVGLLIGMIAGSAVPEYELVFHPVGSARHSGYLVGVYTHPLREVEVRRLMEAAGGGHIRVRAMRDTPLRVYGQNQRDYATTAPAGTAPADREVPPTA
jgi:uncharacterized membrane protein YeaQ/YmgE (transglycosylase-associated protein family)